MKRKNLIKISLLLAAVMTLTACSSKNKDDLYQIVNMMYLSSEYVDTTFPGRIDKEHEEALESIFDNINIMGATLSLPMNVSDLPEGFTLTVGNSAIETYDGKHIVLGEITFGEDITVCSRVYILQGKKQNVSQGVIVGYEFDTLLKAPLVYDRDGHNLIFMLPSDVTELLGEQKAIGYKGDYSSYKLVYTDAHGRRAGWRYEELTDNDAITMYNFTLTAHSALDWLYLI